MFFIKPILVAWSPRHLWASDDFIVQCGSRTNSYLVLWTGLSSFKGETGTASVQVTIRVIVSES